MRRRLCVESLLGTAARGVSERVTVVTRSAIHIFLCFVELFRATQLSVELGCTRARDRWFGVANWADRFRPVNWELAPDKETIKAFPILSSYRRTI